MVPGNAEEAAGIEVDEEQGEEEEPPHMLNGTAPCVWGSPRTPRPSFDLHSPLYSPLPAYTCLRLFTHVDSFVPPHFHTVCYISFSVYRTLDRLPG